MTVRSTAPQPAPAPGAANRAVVDVGVYRRDGRRQPFSGAVGEALAAARRIGGFAWVGLHDPSPDLLDAMAEVYGLHPLAIEDALNARSQRPKVDNYDDLSFLVLKTVHYVPHASVTSTSQIIETGVVLLFSGPDFVITIRHGDHGELRDIRRRLEDKPDLLGAGPAAVTHAVADSVVDDYLRVANSVELDIDEVEASVFTGERTRDIERIYQLKREVLELKRAVAPAVGPLRQLAERAPASSEVSLREYFRDVEDHLLRVREQIASYDELLTSILQANLTQITVKESEDMRRISAWVAIAAVPTMIAGIYGMNFDDMPELHWSYGYPTVVGATAFICLALYRGFKRNGWL